MEVNITFERQEAATIIADNENEYQAKVADITKELTDWIEVKKVVGIIIPFSTENSPF